MNKQIEEIELFIRARYPIIYITSWEEERVEQFLNSIALNRNKHLFLWSITKGIHPFSVEAKAKFQMMDSTRDPLMALDQVIKFADPAVYVFKDLHLFIQDPTIVRKLRDLASHLKKSFKTLIILSPVLRVPCELEKDITVCDFDLPDKQELGELMDKIIKDVGKSSNISFSLSDLDRERILNAALGLTLTEAENVFARTLVKNGRLDGTDVSTILSEKQQIIKKSQILEYYSAEEKFDQIGGLDVLKKWLAQRLVSFSEDAKKFGLPNPRGVMVIGVQGAGKSLTAKALSGIWNMPLLRLDMARIFNSAVGASEHNMRMAIKTAESIAPVVLWIDEIEKAFAGVESSSFSDAGTTARVFGNFLVWLQEKKTPVFVIATSNNIKVLPPELLRKGRFDEIFFVDLPVQNEREEIFRIHLKKRDQLSNAIDIPLLAKEAQGFSGAEIEQAVISSMFDAYERKSKLDTDMVLKSVRQSVPLSTTMREEINALREWASKRTRRASSVQEIEDIPQYEQRRLEF